MSNNEDRANKEMIEGEKCLNKGFYLFGNKYEDAVPHFERAANLYKMAKEWKMAGEAWNKLAECHKNLNQGFEAANALVESSKLFQKVDVKQSISNLLFAIDYYLNDGKFSIAARHYKSIAEMYEAEGDLENAIEYYLKASDIFDTENSDSSANTCLIKIADYSAQLQKYDTAIEIYEKLAFKCLQNNLLKYSVKDYLLKAALCHLAKDDLVSTKKAVQKYKDVDMNFSSQRECGFLEKLIDQFEAHDVDGFTQAVQEFDRVIKLDALKIKMLLEAKAFLNNEEELF